MASLPSHPCHQNSRTYIGIDLAITTALQPSLHPTSHCSLSTFVISSTWAPRALRRCFCWGRAGGIPIHPLRVANNLKKGNLTVMNLAGCCSPCGPNDPAGKCLQCRDVFVERGKEGTVDTHVGPYPLPSLQMSMLDEQFCVRGSDLELLVQSVTLLVVSDWCGPHNSGLRASAMLLTDIDELAAPPQDLCLIDCEL